MTTFATAAAIGEREQLADVIYRIDPAETPIFSNVKKETSNGIFTEWQVQELASASTTNYHNEGADTATAAATPTARVGNYHQISKKVFATSGTLDAVDTAGREREHNYQKVLKALELRRDIEKMIGDTDVARSSSEPRKSASLSCWMTNGSVGAGSSITNQYGFHASSLGSAINNFGFYADISTTGDFQYYSAGSSPNYFKADTHTFVNGSTNVLEITGGESNFLTNVTATNITASGTVTGATGTFTQLNGTDIDFTTSLEGPSATITNISGTSATYTSFTGDLTGNVTGDVTGNADTATQVYICLLYTSPSPRDS